MGCCLFAIHSKWTSATAPASVASSHRLLTQIPIHPYTCRKLQIKRASKETKIARVSLQLDGIRANLGRTAQASLSPCRKEAFSVPIVTVAVPDVATDDGEIAQSLEAKADGT